MNLKEKAHCWRRQLRSALVVTFEDVNVNIFRSFVLEAKTQNLHFTKFCNWLMAAVENRWSKMAPGKMEALRVAQRVEAMLSGSLFED